MAEYDVMHNDREQHTSVSRPFTADDGKINECGVLDGMRNGRGN
jgi:hypothetical protein